ncbi:hypothetical protein DL771_005986 [Monosporascus sp. 5C6A]|nr:hypothetical protein DL771_005986 [Monosporascus sp. 5C6A]
MSSSRFTAATPGEVPDEERLPAPRLLVRSYFAVCRELGPEAWLAHGSLLGWYWNGRIMPWDHDVDAQVTLDTTATANARTGTVGTASATGRGDEDSGGRRRRDRCGRPERETTGEFLLDVSPHYAAPRGNGGNVMTKGGGSPGPLERQERPRLRGAPAVAAAFEGVPASVPFDFAEILSGEYGVESLYVTQYLEHEWDEHLMELIKMENPPAPPSPSAEIVGEEEVVVSATTSK